MTHSRKILAGLLLAGISPFLGRFAGNVCGVLAFAGGLGVAFWFIVKGEPAGLITDHDAQCEAFERASWWS